MGDVSLMGETHHAAAPTYERRLEKMRSGEETHPPKNRSQLWRDSGYAGPNLTICSF